MERLGSASSSLDGVGKLKGLQSCLVKTPGAKVAIQHFGILLQRLDDKLSMMRGIQTALQQLAGCVPAQP